MLETFILVIIILVSIGVIVMYEANQTKNDLPPKFPGLIFRGLVGDNVTSVQEYLVSKGFNLLVDGIFGVKTEGAVKDFQRRNNLKVDGLVGPNTWAALTGSK